MAMTGVPTRFSVRDRRRKTNVRMLFPCRFRAKVVLLFLLLGVGLYANSLSNPFHYDDLHSVRYNPHIRRLDAVPAFFLDPGTFSGRLEGFMFRPVLLVTYALNYAIHGQQVEGYRWVNLLLHIGCTLLFYRLCQQIGADAPASWAAALLFLLHPLHAEPVNYISARSDLLVSFLYLLAMVLSWPQSACAAARSGAQGRTQQPSDDPAVYGAAQEGAPRAARSWRRWWAVPVFGAALLTKSVAITFPVVLALATWSSLGWTQLRRDRVYYAVLCVPVLAYLVLIWSNRFLPRSLASMPRTLDAQLWTQIKALIYYLRLAVFPVGLTVEHPFTVSSQPLDPVVITAALLVVSLMALALILHARLVVLGLLVFGVVLLPASLMPLNILVSERRVYLALGGLLLVAGWIWQTFSRQRRRAAVSGILWLALLLVLAWQRNQTWSSDIRIWTEAVERGPYMHRSRVNLGLAYERAGKLDVALEHLHVGLQLRDDHGESWVAVGNIQRALGRTEQAEAAYQRALILQPALAGVYHNLANIEFVDRGTVETALPLYEKALDLDPHLVQARNNYGQALEVLGQFEAAYVQYRRAVQDSLYWVHPRDPELGGAWYNLARLLDRKGDHKAALYAYRSAHTILRAAPEFAAYAAAAQNAIARLEDAGP